jgi:hypothetical protein
MIAVNILTQSTKSNKQEDGDISVEAFVCLLRRCCLVVNMPAGWGPTTKKELRSRTESATTPVSSMSRALDAAPIGSLGPKGTNREHFVHYDSLYFLAMQYGRDAKTFMEVGCAADPFAQYLSWIDSPTCVAPYQVLYQKGAKEKQADSVEFIKADWMEFKEKEKYDLLLCSQVVENVPDPAAFLKKLITAAKTSIISVPYRWRPCGKCNHISNNISLDTIQTWSAPYSKPTHHTIIEEDGGGPNSKRIIVVFQN